MRSTFKRGLRLIVVSLLAGLISPLAMGQLSDAAVAQMAALISDKQNRTPEEQKLDSNLLFAMRAVIQQLSGTALAPPIYVANFIAEKSVRTTP